MTVPFTFATMNSPIPLADLDACFAAVAAGLFNGVVSVSTNTTLTVNQAGGLVSCSGGGGYNVSLPAANSLSAGNCYSFVNVGTGLVGVVRTGTDVLLDRKNQTGTTLSLSAGDFAVLYCNGSTGWVLVTWSRKTNITTVVGPGSGNFTTTWGAIWGKIRIIAGGGGAGGTGTGAASGGAGGSSTFTTPTAGLICGGGAGSPANSNSPGGGGTSSAGFGFGLTGVLGQTPGTSGSVGGIYGGKGAGSPWGDGGAAGNNGASWGSGGGGATSGVGFSATGGGGSGGWCEGTYQWVTNGIYTYAYTVGGGGTLGGAGTGGSSGGAGAPGVLLIEEYFG